MWTTGGRNHFQSAMDGDRDEQDPLEDVDGATWPKVKIERGEDLIIKPELTTAANMEREGEEEGDLAGDDHRGHEMKGGVQEPCQINLLSHCVFCLRETRDQKRYSYRKSNSSTNPSELLEVVPRTLDFFFPPSGLLSTLNQLWTYLQQQNGGSDDADDVGGFPLFAGGRTATFANLPEMCHFCVGKLESVHKLCTDLITEIKKLGKVVRESKYGGDYFWRAENFERALRNSTLEEESIEATLNCLGKLAKEDSQVVKDIRKKESGPPNDEPEETEESVVHDDCAMDYEEDCHNRLDDDDKDPEDNWDGDNGGDSDDTDYVQSKTKTHQPKRKRKPKDPDWCAPTPHFRRQVNPKAQDTTKKVAKPKPGPEDMKFFCELCDYQTTEDRHLRVHMRRQHKLNVPSPRTIQCDLCKDTVLPGDMYAHVRDHVGKDYCIHCPNPNCPQVYSQPSSLSNHLNYNKTCKDTVSKQDLAKFPSKRHTCETCGMNTGRAQTLRSHLTEKHESGDKNFSCPVSGCDRKFTLRQSVVFHLPQHDFSQSVTTQPCDLCDNRARFNCGEDMESHLKEVHGVQDIIKCNQCAFLFSTWEALIDHLYEHRYGVLTCDICKDGVRFSRHCDLLEHYFKTHQIGKMFQCEECGSVYSRRGHLTEHLKREHKNGEEANEEGDVKLPVGATKTLYKCEECDIAYKSSLALREHNIRLHGADKFKCRFCSDEFSKLHYLQKHERDHRGVPAKIYRCEVEGCGKSYKSNKMLKNHHSVIHLGLRSHVCETCGKSYTDANGLREHMNSVHLKLRPFICNECGESFPFRETLRRHMTIHTGERPFACELCGQRFRYKGGLKVHLEGHERKGADFKPTGPMKQNRKRVEPKRRQI